MRDTGINAGDVAKAILDYGIHSPTVYFPMIVKEALLIEPTEAETKTALDDIVDAFEEIAENAYADAEKVKNMPYTTSKGRLDEFSLAKNPVLIKKNEY